MGVDDVTSERRDEEGTVGTRRELWLVLERRLLEQEWFENGGHPGHPFGFVRRQDFGLLAALARAPRS